MQGGGPADPCPHFLQGHTNKPSGVDRRARPGRQCQGQKVREAGEVPRGQGWWAPVWVFRTRRLMAERTEPVVPPHGRSVISVYSPLSTCWLRPSARRLCARRS